MAEKHTYFGLFSVTTQSPDWNILLIEQSRKGVEREKKTSPAFLVQLPIRLFCLPESSLLPDYATHRHTQPPQSMPHATPPFCTHLFAMLGSHCQDQRTEAAFKDGLKVSNPPCCNQENEDFVFG